MTTHKKKIISVIAIKFSLLVSFLILVIMSIMAGLVLKNARESKLKSLEIRASSFARDSREAVFPRRDMFRLHFSVLETMKEPAIVYAMVQDTEGKILSHNFPIMIGEYDYSQTGKQALRTKKLTILKFLDDNQYAYDITVPLYAGNVKVGIARVGYTDASVREALRDTFNKIMIITLGLLGMGIILTIVVVNIMVKPVNELVRAANRVARGNLDFKITIKNKDELGDLARTFNDMIQGLRERDFIRDTFGKYVTKEVARAILNGRLTLGGERKQVTVLIADLRNFTAMSEHMSPESVVEMLNEYFTGMVDIIFKYEGTLDKYIGDSLFAIFGAPITHDDDPQRAVKAALDMQEAFRQMNFKRSAQGLKELKMGIAINTGEVVAGNIGSEKRMEYTVIGDTVNTAARIEALNREWGTDFLISSETYQMTKDMVDVEKLAVVRLRGRDAETGVYRVLGKKEKQQDIIEIPEPVGTAADAP